MKTKRNVFAAMLAVASVVLLLGLAIAQPPGQGGPAGQGAQGSGGWYCPYCGSGMGRGMGPGGQGGWMNCPMMQGGGMMHQHGGMGATQPGKPLTEDQAKTMVQNYIQSMNNPNLKLGKVTEEKGKDYYVVDIVTQEGSLADKIHVNKNTGWFRSAYTQ